LISDFIIWISLKTGGERQDIISIEELTKALTAYVEEDPAIFTGKTNPKPSLNKAAEVYARGLSASVKRYYKKHLKKFDDKATNEDESGDDIDIDESEKRERVKSQKLEAIKLIIKNTPGNPIFLDQRHFTQEQCDNLAATLEEFSELGFGFSVRQFLELCYHTYQEKLMNLNSHDPEYTFDPATIPVFTKSWSRK